MVQQTVFSDRPDAGVLSDRPQSRSALTFFIGFGLAALLTLGATLGLLTGQGLAGQSNAAITWMLMGVLAICAGLAGILAQSHEAQMQARVARGSDRRALASALRDF